VVALFIRQRHTPAAVTPSPARTALAWISGGAIVAFGLVYLSTLLR
jgi:hypothetical protein